MDLRLECRSETDQMQSEKKKPSLAEGSPHDSQTLLPHQTSGRNGQACHICSNVNASAALIIRLVMARLEPHVIVSTTGLSAREKDGDGWVLQKPSGKNDESRNAKAIAIALHWWESY